MMIRLLLCLLLALPLSGLAATLIGPAEFEQIWLLNNQRNLVARFQQRNAQFRDDPKPLWRIDIESTANQQIRTSAGNSEAILDRMGMHFQDQRYLFMVDWLSLIPQPQTTEGFTYGDMVLGRSWQHDEKLGYTLGARLQTRPNTVQIGGQSAFNLVNNASHDSLGMFAHLTYDGWDVGTYYSGQDGNQANSLSYTLIDSETRGLTTSLTHLGGAPTRNIPARNELSFTLREQLDQHEMRASVTAAAYSGVQGAKFSNINLHYRSPDLSGFRIFAGLYHSYLIDTQERLPGGKFGFEYTVSLDQAPLTMGAFVRRNTFGDIEAMVVRNMPVYAFVMSTRASF